VGALAAIVVATVLGWSYLTRDRVMTPTGGHVRVDVPRGWTGQSSVAFPGHDDGDAGARIGENGRSIAVAYTDSVHTPRDVLGRTVPDGCGDSSLSRPQVGSWSGVAVHYSGCAGGSSVDDVVLIQQTGAQWTVWVEVRSVDGEPDLAHVLSSLDIQP
jgi:hypothetical protein